MSLPSSGFIDQPTEMKFNSAIKWTLRDNFKGSVKTVIIVPIFPSMVTLRHSWCESGAQLPSLPPGGVVALRREHMVIM
jgi:hypothetical protein